VGAVGEPVGLPLLMHFPPAMFWFLRHLQ
jgi:hypothetical protein